MWSFVEGTSWHLSYAKSHSWTHFLQCCGGNNNDPPRKFRPEMGTAVQAVGHSVLLSLPLSRIALRFSLRMNNTITFPSRIAEAHYQMFTQETQLGGSVFLLQHKQATCFKQLNVSQPFHYNTSVSLLERSTFSVKTNDYSRGIWNHRPLTLLLLI